MVYVVDEKVIFVQEGNSVNVSFDGNEKFNDNSTSQKLIVQWKINLFWKRLVNQILHNQQVIHLLLWEVVLMFIRFLAECFI